MGPRALNGPLGPRGPAESASVGVCLWALGCVIYEMFHRQPAFKAEERFELEGLDRDASLSPNEYRVTINCSAPHR